MSDSTPRRRTTPSKGFVDGPGYLVLGLVVGLVGLFLMSLGAEPGPGRGPGGAALALVVGQALAVLGSVLTLLGVVATAVTVGLRSAVHHLGPVESWGKAPEE